MTIVENVRSWVPVRYCPGFECSVVTAGPPTVVLLRQEMEGREPWAVGAARGAILQHCAEFRFGYG